MVFEPAFMRRRAEYLADKERVCTVPGWLRFRKKWFESSEWPTKTPAQWRREHAAKHGPVLLGGRTWGYSFWSYDLSPRARYEYFSTMAALGDPLQFPHMFVSPRPMPERWMQQCPHCEIHTMQRGDDACPRCRRPLVWAMPSE